MKYIELKQVITRKGEAQQLNYASQIEHIVGEAQDNAGGGRAGFDRETNRRALRILDRLEALAEGAGYLALEDADHSFLLGRVNAFIWPFADRAFEEFCKAIEEAPSTQPLQASPATA